jgi:hypothetical protein
MMDGTAGAPGGQRLSGQHLPERQGPERQRPVQAPERPGSGPGQPRRSPSGFRATLTALFPAAAGPSEQPPGQHQPKQWRLASVAVQAAVLGVAAVALLLRIARVPAWDSVYAEDNGVFLVGGLTHPWHLFAPYAGYEELGPRFIGQLVATFVPLVYASDAYAVAGALIGAASALFIYHASDGYIRSRRLRAMLGAALVLLPLAPIDIADSGVDSPWYPMTALFFAALWRPRTKAGMTAAALIAFYATSSEIVAIIYAPLLLIRLVALPRWREHAVTAGWLAGLLAQVPAVVGSYANHAQRLHTGHLSTPGQAVAFYFHNVVLRALGWKLSLHLKELAGYNGATVIVGVILALGIGWAMVIGGRQVQLFAVTALLIGFVQTIITATITSYLNLQVPTWSFLPAARYSTIPIVLIDAIGILGVDAYLRRAQAQAQDEVRNPKHARGQRRVQSRAILAVGALACLLAVGWVTDYRYATERTSAGYWRPVALHWLHKCDRSTTGQIAIPAWDSTTVTVDCSRLRR